MSPREVPATAHELSRIELLAGLPGELLSKLAQRMRREEVPSGEAPVLEGQEGDRFYVVLSGVFAVSNVGALGPRRVLRPGDYFGEVALAMDIPRTASVRALTPATVASCNRETFDEFLRPLFADDE
jgi:ATP-binding cassette, subfamily B, bacterial